MILIFAVITEAEEQLGNVDIEALPLP